MKNTQSEIKAIKRERKPETKYCLGCKDYTDNFTPQEVKMKKTAKTVKSTLNVHIQKYWS